MGISRAAPPTPLSRMPTGIATQTLILRAVIPNSQTNSTIDAATSRWIGRPSGKPVTSAENRWPMAPTMAPSPGLKAAAATKAGAESSATVPVGLGILMKAPTALNAMRIATRAILRGVKNG